MYSQDEVRLQLTGERKFISADGFLSFFHNAIEALKAIDKESSRHGSETLQWEIAAAGLNSPIYATVQGVPLIPGNKDVSRGVGEVFAAGVEHLNQSNTCPRGMNPDSLHFIKKMVAVAFLYRLQPSISTHSRNVQVTAAVASNADWARKAEEMKPQDYIEHGSLEGVLLTLTSSPTRKRDRVVIVNRVTGHATPCHLKRKGLDEVARKEWKHRVVAVGQIYINRKSRKPTKIVASDIRPLAAEAEAIPRIQDIPPMNITGGVESSEYVRGLRYGE